MNIYTGDVIVRNHGKPAPSSRLSSNTNNDKNPASDSSDGNRMRTRTKTSAHKDETGHVGAFGRKEVEDIMDLSCCRLCPRNCGVNRTAGETGFCLSSAALTAARAALYFDEEPVISGHRGSGAVFFTGCNMRCLYCQNRNIALAETGREISSRRLAEIFLELQDQKAENINLVTPSHFLPQIIQALEYAKAHGLTIPVVYNTGTYEKPEAIRALEGLVDVWLPDFKYYSSGIAGAFSAAPDYFDRACEALAEMVRQCPQPLFSDGSSSLDEINDADDPLLIKGVLVRHLVLPGCAEDSRKILRYLHKTYGNQIFISLMNQYTPMPWTGNHPLLSRPVSDPEYDELVDFALELGIENGFIQESGTVSGEYIPAFDGSGL